ncbi:MAG: sulfur carrier protein ThiS, partial [Rikenellaceae bacterium]|nr:sulfur carrier protein ThiS [Rikenellaceae bacterium]
GTLAAVLAELGIDTRGVAIAQGERIIPRTKWSEYQLTEGEHFTLIRATQGG